MDVDLLDLWRTASKDFDSEAVRWLRHGAPAGILEPIKDMGIFPTYDPSIDVAEMSPDELQTAEFFANYAGTDTDPDVTLELDRVNSAGYSVRYPSIQAAEAVVGAPLILSKIGAIKKWKRQKDGTWS